MIGRDVEWVRALEATPAGEWPDFLEAHSGLPGPRANLALLSAVIVTADEQRVHEMESSAGEYPAMCAAACRGARADRSDDAARAHEAAGDERWRVREGVAIGLQALGDRDLPALLRVVQQWGGDPDPLVQRAAVAALCEPRLVRESRAAMVAVEVCASATAQFSAWSEAQCRAPGARVLRQALGYCWSVVVAANPGVALDAFLTLDRGAADIDWIVRENLRKKRLVRVLEAHEAG